MSYQSLGKRLMMMIAKDVEQEKNKKLTYWAFVI